MPGLFGCILISGSMKEIGTQNNFFVTESSIKYLGTNNYYIDINENSRSSARYEDNKITVLFEGVLLNNWGTSKETSLELCRRYIRYGERFVKDLRGSFQLFIKDSRGPDTRYLLFADHTASRPILYIQTEDAFYFSSNIKQLIDGAKTTSINEMAMVHFLISGHFPSGHTAINEIKVLGPGEYLSIYDGTINKMHYFSFDLEPDEQLASREALKSLDEVLTDRIITHWQHANNPAILLSGGYDSQYIFYTIAESVEDTSKLSTVTWGQDPSKPYADMAISRHTAKRFGTRHIEILKDIDNWRTEYNDMFIAQNGMTDSSFYHAHELTVCRNLRKDYGIESLIRGDECLGFGPDAFTLQNALLTNSMSSPKFIPGIVNWFATGSHIYERYFRFIGKLVDQYNYRSFNCLKDLLDFYERQHMNRNPLNYYKMHYVEVFCPLIDPDVLNIFSRFPSKFRRHKNLFKKLTRNKYGRHLKIADFTNLTDWQRAISESGEIKSFLIDELKALPSFCNPVFFHQLVDSIKIHTGKNIKAKLKTMLRPIKMLHPFSTAHQSLVDKRRYRNQQLIIPAHLLLIRAAVIGRWNDWWIKP